MARVTARYDAVVVGSGPNGLAAAITVARRGGSVIVFEAAGEVGGGMRTGEVTLPGFQHDICSAVHPLAVSSPFFSRLPLQNHGLEWIYPPNALVHPLDDGSVVTLNRSVAATAEFLGPDASHYRELMTRLVASGDELLSEIMRPLVHFPKHPFQLARFGLKAIQPARRFAEMRFSGARARALFAGLAGHSMIPLSWPGSSASALVLAVAAHLRGWPIPRGGSRSIAYALTSYLRSLGGEVRTGAPVARLEDLPPSRWVFLDITPRQLSAIGASLLSESQRRRLLRFRPGMGVYKMDFALSGPIPWNAKECASAATVHLGGTLPEIAESELKTREGTLSSKPFVILVQPSLFDPSRAPPGRHTAWAYCHVPNGSTADRSGAIEAQIERYAPGFRGKIEARKASGPRELEAYNANLLGGDISGGEMSLAQIIRRPRLLFPYSTPIPGVFLCSSSTPPGPGVHGMCGSLAAEAAMGPG